MVGALKVTMKVFVFLLPQESSLTEMFLMSETPWGFSSEIISSLVNKWSTPDDPLAGVESPVRAGCNRAASQVVQLVDYTTLHGRGNLQQEVSVSESPESFNCPHCAFYGFAQKDGESLELEWSLSTDWTTNHLS